MRPGAIIIVNALRDDADDAPLDMNNKPVYAERTALLERLKNATGDILCFVDDAISRLSSMEGLYQFLPIPGFERNLELMLMKQSDMSRSSGMAGNSVIPFYKTNEPLRLCNVICEKLGKEQLKPGMSNVLAIYSTSLTMHGWHVPLALDIMREKAEQGNDQFFCDRRHGAVTGVNDYLAKIGNLSGIWFRTKYHTEKSANGDNGWIESDEMTRFFPNPATAHQLTREVETLLGQLPVP